MVKCFNTIGKFDAKYSTQITTKLNKPAIIYRIAWFFKNLIENEYIARKLQQTYNNL